MCPFCGASVPDLASHYASDDCPPLVIAFGALTAAGKQREIEAQHYRANEMEQAEKEMHEHPARTRGKGTARLGFVERATECRQCGAPVWRNGRCQKHEQELMRSKSLAYYYANRETVLRKRHEKRERQQVGA